MIAKNKLSGMTFKVLDDSGTTFSGKVINDLEGVWKKGEVCHNLQKSSFNIIISWVKYDNIKKKIREVKSAIDLI